MISEQQTRYEELVYDGARDLASRYSNFPHALIKHLIELGATPEEIHAVDQAMRVECHTPEFYRGRLCDIAVVEVCKDVLRRVHGFEGPALTSKEAVQ